MPWAKSTSIACKQASTAPSSTNSAIVCLPISCAIWSVDSTIARSVSGCARRLYVAAVDLHEFDLQVLQVGEERPLSPKSSREAGTLGLHVMDQRRCLGQVGNCHYIGDFEAHIGQLPTYGYQRSGTLVSRRRMAAVGQDHTQQTNERKRF